MKVHTKIQPKNNSTAPTLSSYLHTAPAEESTLQRNNLPSGLQKAQSPLSKSNNDQSGNNCRGGPGVKLDQEVQYNAVSANAARRVPEEMLAFNGRDCLSMIKRLPITKQRQQDKNRKKKIRTTSV